MTHQLIGYVRVSSQGQNTARQLQGIELDMEFIDKVTGSNLNREKLQECILYARKGDTVVIDSIDRLARSLRDLQEILETLTKKGVIVKFLKENLTFTGSDDAMSTLMLQMMGAFAEFERNMIRARQKEGIDLAKKEGKHLGRKLIVTKNVEKKAQELREQGISIRKISFMMGLSRPSIYKALGLQKTREP